MIPEAARSLLQTSTAIWLNGSLIYGHEYEPITGTGCCYYSVPEYLLQNAMCPEKLGCIEIYNAADYLRDADLWGKGGLLLHELSHAYHDKCCLNGDKNEDIEEAYRIAMSSGLYDCVNVHGPEGVNGPIEAYACKNKAEFFAELSVAYLCADDDVEYNKWFPHNRTQLLQHDPATFAVVDRVWWNPCPLNDA